MATIDITTRSGAPLGVPLGQTNLAEAEHQVQLLQPKEEEIVPVGESTTTLHDYRLANNPLARIAEVPMGLDVLKSNTKADWDAYKSDFDKLPQNYQTQVLENAHSVEHAKAIVKMNTLRDTSEEKIKKDSYWKSIPYGLGSYLTTPGSIATLPFLEVKAGYVAAATTWGAISGGATFIDEMISKASGVREENVLKNTAYAAAFGATLGIGSEFLFGTNKIVNKALMDDPLANLGRDSTIVSEYVPGSDMPIIRAVKETEAIDRVVPHTKDAPEYIEALKIHEDTYLAKMEEYHTAVEDIKASKLDEVGTVERELKDLKATKEEQLTTIKETPIEVTPTREVTKKVMTPVTEQVALGDNILLSQAKDIPEVKTQLTTLSKEHKTTIDSINTQVKEVTKAIKALPKQVEGELKKTTKAREVLNNKLTKLEKTLEKTKTTQQEAVNKVLATATKKLPKTKDVIKNRWLESVVEVAKTPAEIAKETSKIQKELTAQSITPILAKEAELTGTLKTLQAQEKVFKAEALAALQKPVKPKFTPPTKIETIHKETGVTRIEGMINTPRLKLFGLDRVFPALAEKLASTLHTLVQSESELVRNIGYRLASPSVSVRFADGSKPFVQGQTMDSYIKGELRGQLQGRLMNRLRESYGRTRKEGFVTSKQQYADSLDTGYRMMQAEHDELAYAIARQDTTPNLTFQEKLVKAYDATEPNMNIPDWLKEGIGHYREYYKDFGSRAKKLELEGMKGISTNKWYAPVVYNKELINSGKLSLAQLKNDVYNGLRHHPEQDKLSDIKVQELADAVVTTLRSISFDMNMSMHSFVIPEGLPLGQHLIGKTIHMNPNYIKSFTKANMDEVANVYFYRMAGRLGMQKFFGESNISGVMDAIKQEAMTLGSTITPKEIRALQLTLEDLTGTLRLATMGNEGLWQFTRTLKAFNVVRLLGQTGLLQITELAGNIFWHGAQGNTMTRFKQPMQDAINLVYKNGEVDSEYAKFILDMGFLNDALHTNMVNGLADGELGLNAGFAEKLAHSGANIMMKVNGTKVMFAMQQQAVGSALIQQIKRLNPTKITEAELTRLSRWGLTKERALSIRNDLLAHTDHKLDKFELNNFAEDNKKALQNAMYRGISETVVQADSIHAAPFTKVPEVVNSLIFQFYKFTSVTHNTLLKTGLTEEKAAWAASIIGSALAYANIQALREEASVALGMTSESDRKYDIYNDADHMQHALAKGVGYTASLGLLTMAYDDLAMLTGQPKLGGEDAYRATADNFLGASAGMLTSIVSTTSNIGMNEGDVSEKDVKKMTTLIPFQNLPLLKEALASITKEQF